MPTDDYANKYWLEMLEMIMAHGWAVASVLSDGRTAGSSYTIGLSAKGLPELIIVGVNPEHAQSMINRAAKKLIANEFSGEAGELLKEVANMPLAPRFLAKDVASELALGAARFASNNGIDMRMIQLVLPDMHGHFPWDPKCTPSIVEMQTLAQDPWIEGSPTTLH